MIDMYVIYKNPSDYPDQYVLRKWKSGRGKIMVFGLGEDNKVYLWSGQNAAWLPTWVEQQSAPTKPKGPPKKKTPAKKAAGKKSK